MFKHYFERIEGIEIYPLVSLVIFFVFFVLLIIWVISVDKKYIDEMKNLPLSNNDVYPKNDNNG